MCLYGTGGFFTVAEASRLHDLHRQTKLASPLLPDISLDSYQQSVTGLRPDWTRQAALGAYTATDADPVGMDLSTGCALDSEGVVEWIFRRVIGAEVCHSVSLVSIATAPT